MSWVFLTEARAYKLKKPVRYAFLDHRTLTSRQRACEEEVRLNRRLAVGVYLGVLPVARVGDAPRRRARAPRVDWVVHMRRLAADRMLDRKITEGMLRPGEHRAAAALLARFYRGRRSPARAPGNTARGSSGSCSPPGTSWSTRGSGCPSRTSTPRPTLPSRCCSGRPDSSTPAWRAACRVPRRPAPGARGPRAGARGDRLPRVRQGPADPRPRRRARLPVPGVRAPRSARGGHGVRRGVPPARRRRPARRLLDLYAVLRSLVRAKLAVWHAREPDDSARWIARAAQYVRLARDHGRRLG